MLDQLERYADRLSPYTELRLHNNHQAMVAMVGGTLMSNQATTIGGVSARSYQDGAFGFASLPSLSNDAIPQVLEQAMGNADLLQRRARRRAGDLPESGAGVGVFDHRSRAAPPSAQQQVDVVRAHRAHLRHTYPPLLHIDVPLQRP